MADQTAQSSTPGGRTIAGWVHIKKDPKKLIQERFAQAREAFKDKIEDRRKIRNSYHGYVKDVQRRRGRANFPYYKVFPQIELESARFITNYFRHDPFIGVSATKGAASDGALRLERTMQHYLEYCPAFFISKVRTVKYSLLYGSGFEMPTWRRTVVPVKRSVPITYAGVEVDRVEVTTNEVVYDGLDFKVFHPNDVYPYPFATDLQSAPWVILVQFIPINELLQLAEQGVYDKDAVMRIPLTGHLQHDWDIYKQQADGGGSPRIDEELICLQHCFESDRFLTLANDSEIIRDQGNFYWHNRIPMVHGIKTIDPDSLWAIGSAKNLLANEKLLALFMNSMVDSAVSSLWPIWKHTAHVSRNDLLSLPNQRILVKSMDDVDIVKMPEMKQDMLALKALIEASCEELTGYFGSQKGGGSGAPTATSDQIFQQEGNTRIQYDVMTYEHATLLPEARICAALIQQFMPPTVDVRLNGPGGNQFQQVSKEDVAGEFNFRTSGASEALSRSVIQMQLIDLFNTAAAANQYVQMPDGSVIPVPVLDVYNALKEIYEGFGRTNTDKLLYRPEIFGMPLDNSLLNQYGLPSIPALDQLQPNPNTGALRKLQGNAPLQNMNRSVSPKQIINNSARPAPQPMRVM